MSALVGLVPRIGFINVTLPGPQFSVNQCILSTLFLIYLLRILALLIARNSSTIRPSNINKSNRRLSLLSSQSTRDKVFINKAIIYIRLKVLLNYYEINMLKI